MLMPMLIGSGEAMQMQYSAHQTHPAREPAVEDNAHEGSPNSESSGDANHAAFHQFQRFLQWQQQAELFEEYLRHRNEFLLWKGENGQQQVEEALAQEQATKEYERLFAGTLRVGRVLASHFVSPTKGAEKKFTSKKRKVLHHTNSVPRPVERNSKVVFSSVGPDAEITVDKVEDVQMQLKDSAQNTTSHTQIAEELVNSQPPPENIVDESVQDTGNVQSYNESTGGNKPLAVKVVQGIPYPDSFGDVVIVSGLLLVLACWFVGGIGPIFWHAVWCGGNLLLLLQFLMCPGRKHTTPKPQITFRKIHLEVEGGKDGPYLEKDGIMKPTTAILRREWRDLTKGQRYVFELVGLTPEQWNKAVAECKKTPGTALCQALDCAWSEFNEVQVQLLDALDIVEDIWSDAEPEHLNVQHKLWEDLSSFERHVAYKLGVHRRDNGKSWDERTAPIFHIRWTNMRPDQQMKLRSIGFHRDHWHCYRDPVVPEYTQARAGFEYIVWFYESFKFLMIWIWITVEIIWVLMLLWRLKLIQQAYGSMSHYLVFLLLGLAVVLSLIRMLRPVWNFVQAHIICEVRIVCSHVKDLWEMTSRMLHLRVVHDACMHHCGGLTCTYEYGHGCCAICGGRTAHGHGHGHGSYQYKESSGCLPCFPKKAAQPTRPPASAGEALLMSPRSPR